MACLELHGGTAHYCLYHIFYADWTLCKLWQRHWEKKSKNYLLLEVFLSFKYMMSKDSIKFFPPKFCVLFCIHLGSRVCYTNWCQTFCGGFRPVLKTESNTHSKELGQYWQQSTNTAQKSVLVDTHLHSTELGQSMLTHIHSTELGQSLLTHSTELGQSMLTHIHTAQN